MSADETVRAAGCLVWRLSPPEASTGPVQILVIHRSRYDDWSFPKGKRNKGETDLECALREVKEETSVTGKLGSELETIHYRDHKNRHKVVRYWLLQSDGSAAFVANDEVDRVRWLSPGEAVAVLSYGHDRKLVGQFLAAPR